jgi:hypothetical protein
MTDRKKTICPTFDLRSIKKINTFEKELVPKLMIMLMALLT